MWFGGLPSSCVSARPITIIPTYAPTLSTTIISTICPLFVYNYYSYLYAPKLSGNIIAAYSAITIISTYAPILITSLLCTYLAWGVYGVYVVYKLVGVLLSCGCDLVVGTV